MGVFRLYRRTDRTRTPRVRARATIGYLCQTAGSWTAAVNSWPYGVNGSTTRVNPVRNMRTGKNAEMRIGPVICPVIFAKNSVIPFSLRGHDINRPFPGQAAAETSKSAAGAQCCDHFQTPGGTLQQADVIVKLLYA